MIIKRRSFAEAYDSVLTALINDYEYITSPRGQKIKEIIGLQLEIENPYSNLFRNSVRDLPLQYLADELYLYFNGSNSAEEFSNASTFWNKIKNEDGTVNSAYGYLIFKNPTKYGMTQWEWAKQSLIKDEDSRQAVMHYNTPDHQYEGVKDFVCTMSNQFFIRDNCLDMITYIRSQDWILGSTFDIPWFMLLMQCMRIELLPYYPNLELGKYIHFVGSCHLYERNFEMAEKMSEKMFNQDWLPRINKLPYNGFSEDDEFCKWVLDHRKVNND